MGTERNRKEKTDHSTAAAGDSNIGEEREVVAASGGMVVVVMQQKDPMSKKLREAETAANRRKWVGALLLTYLIQGEA